jgi:glycogen(starch) synthase
MRILFWTEMFWPYLGGVEVLSSKLLAELRARGHELLVVTSHLDNATLPDHDQRDGVRIERFNFREPLVRRDIRELARVRRRLAEVKEAFAADVVHLNFSGPSAYYHLATLEAHPCPWLVTVHRAAWQGEAGPETLTSKVLRTADWVSAVSEGVLASVRRLAGEVTPRSSIVYNGLERPELAAVPLPWTPPCLVCLGRLIHDKGFDVALDAFHSLVKRSPSIRLIIAGDGPARSDLEAQASALGVSGSVEFAGLLAQSEVPALMNRATLVLVPSRVDEGFGLVALEAALMGRPVVASDVGGLREVVINGETGLTFVREDAASLADAARLLLEDQALAERLGQAARNRATRKFSLAAAADGYEAIYRRLSGRTEAAARALDPML